MLEAEELILFIWFKSNKGCLYNRLAMRSSFRLLLLVFSLQRGS